MTTRTRKNNKLYIQRKPRKRKGKKLSYKFTGKKSNMTSHTSSGNIRLLDQLIHNLSQKNANQLTEIVNYEKPEITNLFQRKWLCVNFKSQLF